MQDVGGCVHGDLHFLQAFLGVFETAIASKLAPTLDWGAQQIPCGSELARDEALLHTAVLATDGLARILHNP
ncbi:hypothetical protein FHK92_25470 [Pseudomonas brassicacearum subsp. neoaurantiaca]|uniref:Uncharacterized protein n=1 Tax=Pseudomonas brassicacearum subsp. neoaurantiaca TaxID=494916 RepID=A0A7V8UGD5_9PSED|nr:hypothetical protein [Pseudomonas brassicacearum subsp. neoaurantiaca]